MDQNNHIIRIAEGNLRDIIGECVSAVISEMAYPASFNMDEFKRLKTFAKRLEYCKARLPRIGAGSSRVVFKVDNDKVLKLAKNRKGIAQNLVEINELTDIYSSVILPEIFDYDEDGLFLECELCRKATEKDFHAIYGVPWGALCCVAWKEYLNHNRRGWNPYSEFEPVVQQIWKGGDNDTSEFLDNVREYVANHSNNPVYDLTRVANWGIDFEGYFKLVDCGLDDDVYRQYYGGR